MELFSYLKNYVLKTFEQGSLGLSISEFFKAYPSIEETSDGGLDNKAVTGFANVFPNEFKTNSS